MGVGWRRKFCWFCRKNGNFHENVPGVCESLPEGQKRKLLSPQWHCLMLWTRRKSIGMPSWRIVPQRDRSSTLFGERKKVDDEESEKKVYGPEKTYESHRSRTDNLPAPSSWDATWGKLSTDCGIDAVHLCPICRRVRHVRRLPVEIEVKVT